jgi:hypothetical protein
MALNTLICQDVQIPLVHKSVEFGVNPLTVFTVEFTDNFQSLQTVLVTRIAHVGFAPSLVFYKLTLYKIHPTISLLWLG